MNLNYLWIQPAFRWKAFAALALLFAMALAAGALHWQSGRHALTSAEAAFQLAEQGAVNSRDSAISVVTPIDFVATMPPRIDTHALLDAVRAALTQRQLTLLGLQVQPKAIHEEPGQLGRMEVVLRAQGEYGKEKQLLGDLIARLPSVTVPRLKFRSGVSDVPGLVDMEATLVFWAQPHSAPGVIPAPDVSVGR